jgi:hypothetical protein
MIGLLVGVIMVMEGVAWLLLSTGMVKDFPSTQRQVRFSTLMVTPAPIEHIHLAQSSVYVTEVV